MTGEDVFRGEVMPHLEVMAMLAARLAPSAAPGTVVRTAYALAVRYRAGFDPARASLRSWLLAITVDCAHTARPRRGRAATPAVPGGDPGERPVLDVALASLPDRQRFAVDCIHFVGLSLPETAELMRLPQRSVRAAEATAQRRIRTAVVSGEGTSGEEPADLLQAAGAAWRAAFREMPRADLQERVAPQTEPRPRRPIRTRWVLTAVGVVVLIAGGTVAVLTVKRAGEVAAADQAHRAYQLCGEIPPGLEGVTVRRLGEPTDGSFRVRVVADRSMTVVSAKVTGVDENGRIATYVKYDDSAQMWVSVVKIEEAGHPMVVQSSVATDPCDSSPSRTPELTDHLLLVAVGGVATRVMDAGPVDRLIIDS